VLDVVDVITNIKNRIDKYDDKRLQIRKIRRRLQATAATEQPMTVPSVRATTKKVLEPLKGKRPEAPLTLNTPEVPLMKNPLIMTKGESTALFSCCQSICSATDPAVVAAKEQSVENPTIYCVAGCIPDPVSHTS